MYHVVLVDDEPFILNGLIKVLPWEKLNCCVVGTANDGKEGLELIRKTKPDILLTDIRMPGMDGLQMTAALKSEYPRLKISVLTAFRDFDYARTALHLGVTRYLLKPSKMDELTEAFEAMTAELKSEAAIEPAADEGEAGCFVVNAALKFIKEHSADHLTLQEVADSVYVSQWHLSKLLNKQLKKGFFDIVNDMRIERAKELLAEPKSSVCDIAFAVGYSDAAQFSRTFKRLTGKTPLAYRAML